MAINVACPDLLAIQFGTPGELIRELINVACRELVAVQFGMPDELIRINWGRLAN